MNVTHWIRGYEKQGERLVEEHPLDQDQLSQLRALIGIREDEPIIDVYPIAPEHAEPVNALCSLGLDFEALDYYLEADADS